MALTVKELAAAIRAVPIGEELDADAAALIDRLLRTGIEIINTYAPTAPDAIREEAVIRIAGYLYDAPNFTRTGAAFRESGAMSLIDPWKIRHAGVVEVVEQADSTISQIDRDLETVGLVLTYSYLPTVDADSIRYGPTQLNRKHARNQRMILVEQGGVRRSAEDLYTWPRIAWGPPSSLDPTIEFILPPRFTLWQAIGYDAYNWIVPERPGSPPFEADDDRGSSFEVEEDSEGRKHYKYTLGGAQVPIFAGSAWPITIIATRDSQLIVD